MDVKLQKSIKNRNYAIIGLIILVVIGFGLNFSSIHESENKNQKILKTQYFIQNTDGKVIDTWKEWNPVDYVSIHIKNSAGLSQNKIDIVKNAIMSTETITIDSKMYWKGWKGAADFARDQINISPVNWEIIDDRNALITISLQTKKHPDGIAGISTMEIDESSKNISYASITIFDARNLSDMELGTILRHEGGHLAGLSHSNDPTDLLYPVVSNSNPYISQCNVDALISLYDTNVIREFICKN